MSIKYEPVIYWSAEDGAFVVGVPELPGCLVDGETYEQAVSSAQIVIEKWPQTAREPDRSVPEPRGHYLMYYT